MFDNTISVEVTFPEEKYGAVDESRLHRDLVKLFPDADAVSIHDIRVLRNLTTVGTGAATPLFQTVEVTAKVTQDLAQ